jgi:transposase
MNTSYSYCGLDVSKATLDLRVYQAPGKWQFPNTAKGHRGLIAHLQSIHTQRIVLESSGGYERAVAIAMVNAGLGVHVAQPQTTAAFAKSLGIRAKTDNIDSNMLARFAHDRQDLRLIEKIDMKHEALHALVVRRDELVVTQTQEKNRLQQASNKAVLKTIRQSLKFLGKQIDAVEQEIDRIIDGDQTLSARAEKFDAVKGIGRQTARVLVAMLPELGTVSTKQLNALVGVAPYDDSSGKRNGKRAIFGGRKLVRNALFMACMTAMWSNATIKPYYESLRARGLAHRTAIVACIRRMLAHLDKESRSLGTAKATAA